MRANKPPKGGSGPVARAVGSDGRRRGPNPVARRPQTKNGLGAQLAVQRPAGARGPLNVAAAKLAVRMAYEQRLASGARPECPYRLQMHPLQTMMQEPSIG